MFKFLQQRKENEDIRKENEDMKEKIATLECELRATLRRKYCMEQALRYFNDHGSTTVIDIASQIENYIMGTAAANETATTDPASSR